MSSSSMCQLVQRFTGLLVVLLSTVPFGQCKITQPLITSDHYLSIKFYLNFCLVMTAIFIFVLLFLVLLDFLIEDMAPYLKYMCCACFVGHKNNPKGSNSSSSGTRLVKHTKKKRSTRAEEQLNAGDKKKAADDRHEHGHGHKHGEAKKMAKHSAANATSKGVSSI